MVEPTHLKNMRKSNWSEFPQVEVEIERLNIGVPPSIDPNLLWHHFFELPAWDSDRL